MNTDQIKQLTTAYTQLSAEAMKTMNLPLQEDVKQQLLKSEIGKQYVNMLDNFVNQLEQGKQSIQNLQK